MGFRENLARASSMRLMKNKLRVAFGYAAQLPTDAVSRAFCKFGFDKIHHSQELNRSERKDTLGHPDSHNGLHDFKKVFTARDVNSIKDFVEDHFARAGLNNAGITADFGPSKSAGQLMDVVIYYPRYDISSKPSPEDVVERLTLKLAKKSQSRRLEAFRKEVRETMKIFGNIHLD